MKKDLFLLVTLTCSVIGGFSYSDELLPLNIVLAGVRHYDSKVKSIKAEIVDDRIIDSSIRIRAEYTLAFMGPRQYLDEKIWEGKVSSKLKLRNPTRIIVYDGERCWAKVIFNSGRVEYTVTTKRNFNGRLDPRSWLAFTWYDYDRYGLADYLIRRKAKMKGKEKLNGEVCYVLEFKEEKRKGKFWIAPYKGFRLLKSEIIGFNEDGGERFKSVREFIYKRFPDDIWFPVEIRVKLVDFSSGRLRIVHKGVMKLKEIEVNTDVSSLFHLDIPLDTKVFDFDSGRSYLAKDIIPREWKD